MIDDHEPEEGEITNSDDEAAEPGDCEYEAISSDEEFTLRQKIEALEARNLELEKIASISSRSMGKCVPFYIFIFLEKLIVERRHFKPYGPANHSTNAFFSLQ